MTPLDITNPDVLKSLYKNLNNKAKIRLVFASLRGLKGFYEQLAVECSSITVQRK
jgi:hypothetical protein